MVTDSKTAEQASHSTEAPELYAVFRNGIPVSDSTYPLEFYAKHEYEYWKGIIRNWPDGSHITIRSIYRRRR